MPRKPRALALFWDEWAKYKSEKTKSKLDVPVSKDVQLTVVGKVFKPNERKASALNRTLSEYFRLVKWYLSFNSKSKSFLHENGYEKAKRLLRP